MFKIESDSVRKVVKGVFDQLFYATQGEKIEALYCLLTYTHVFIAFHKDCVIVRELFCDFANEIKQASIDLESSLFLKISLIAIRGKLLFRVDDIKEYVSWLRLS